MKRRRDNILNQPTVKKPDVSASTDLRSKIGAKLQTLLLANRVETLKRRQAFLLGEPQQHSEIIIDPTVVVKTEAPEIEECNESTAIIDSPNFLLSAKSRITELLNKQQGGTNKFKNSEKENSNSSIECGPVSTVNSATTSLDSLPTQTSCNFQSLSCNSLSKKRRASTNKNCSDASPDVVINQVHLPNMVVVVEDIMKNRTKRTRLSSSKSLSETYSLSSESCSKNKSLSVGKQRKNKAAKDHMVNEVSNSSASCDIDLCTIEDDSTTVAQSCRNSNFADNDSLNMNNSKFTSSKSKSSGNSTNSASISLDMCDLSSEVMDLGDILIATGESSKHCSNHTEYDSELVDDPGLHNNVINRNSTISSNNQILNKDSCDPDVVLLCVKLPTHEVITLEDDDSNDIVEEVHECMQCGKAFRAKSLLNFHIRMHGSDTSSSFQSFSIS